MLGDYCRSFYCLSILLVLSFWIGGSLRHDDGRSCLPLCTASWWLVITRRRMKEKAEIYSSSSFFFMFSKRCMYVCVSYQVKCSFIFMLGNEVKCCVVL